MPLYEYRCRECERVFELRRSMGEADADLACPDGHRDVKRLLAVFSAARGATGPVPAAMPAAPRGGGCGAACGCH